MWPFGDQLKFRSAAAGSVSCREGQIKSLYGYVRTSTASSSPESQEIQLRQAGVPPERVYRDIAVSGRTGAVSRAGWHTLDSSLVADDVLVVASIDRIGRRWLDTVVSILNLQLRQVRIRTLPEAEHAWARYLDADPDSPEAFFGNVLMNFAAWNAHQEVESISRRTKAGLGRAWSGPGPRARSWGVPRP